MQSLKEVAAVEFGSGPATMYLIVFVPDLAQGKSNATVSEDAWTEFAQMLCPFKAKILVFTHGYRRDRHIPWDEFLHSSYHLRNELFRNVDQKAPQLIYLIGEGLGGILVKQVINTACEQPSRWREVLDCCVGIAFLGTPHIRGTSTEWASRLNSVVRRASKTNDKKTIPPHSFSTLHLVCSRFAVNASALHLLILSGFETEPTTQQHKYLSRFRGMSDVVVVDRSFAQIGIPDKETIKEIGCEVRLAFSPGATSSFSQVVFEHCRMAADTLVARQQSPTLVAKDPPLAALSQLQVSGSSEQASLNSQLNKALASNASTQGSGSSSGFVLVPEAKQMSENMKKITLPCYFPDEKYFKPTRTFTGRREELSSIESVLLPSVTNSAQSEESKQNLHTFVLYGLGGSGKTELALQFVQTHYTAFDAVFFLKADTISRLIEEFCQIAIRLGLEPEEAKSSPETCNAAVVAWLENPVRWVESTEVGTLPSRTRHTKTSLAKVLVIFDNADQPEVLSNFWPKAGICSILITSRDPMTVSPFFFPTAHAEVQGLPMKDAICLLMRLTDNLNIEAGDTRRLEAQELVQQLQCLPLAIDQIGAIICKQGLDFRSFLDVYRQEKDFYALQGIHPGQRHYKRTLATVWALDRLEKRAGALLSILALLDPEFIDEEIFFASFNLGCRILYFPCTKAEYYIAKGNLLGTSMISQHKAQLPASSTAVNIHRLVQGAARSRMVADNTISQAFQQVLSSIEALWPWLGRAYTTGSSEKVNRWEVCAKLFPHVEQLATIYVEYFQGGDQNENNVTFAELLGEAGWYQFERENPRVAMPLLHLALEIFGESREGHERVLSNIFSGLVWNSVLSKDLPMVFHYAQKRFDIEEMLETKRGKADSLTAVAYNDLGMAYTLNGVHEKAIPYIQKSKEIRESLPGFRKEWLFSPFLAFGKTYWRLGRHEDAAAILLEALQDREKAFGPDDRQSIRTGSLHYFIGNVRASQKRFDEAYSWHQRALTHYRQTVGDRSPSALRAWLRLAEHELRYRRSKEARDILEKILDAYGNDHYRKHERVQCWFFHAQALRNLAESTKSEESLQNAVTLFNEVNPHDPRTKANLLGEDVDHLNAYDVL